MLHCNMESRNKTPPPVAPASAANQPREIQMTTFNGVLDAAARNADTSNDLAVAAGQIIARRITLGMAAAFDPIGADHAEFSRIVPEKLEAFSAASMIMLERSNHASWEITRIASDEAITTAQATLSIASCADPMAIAEAQRRFALAWFSRAAENFLAIGLLALGAQEAAMVPIRQTIAANSERLGR